MLGEKKLKYKQEDKYELLLLLFSALAIARCTIWFKYLVFWYWYVKKNHRLKRWWFVTGRFSGIYKALAIW